MKIINAQFAGIVTAALLAACAGTPVSLGTHVNGPLPTGAERTIEAEACGFQLLLLIPIAINSRAERAYQELEALVKTVGSGNRIGRRVAGRR